MELLSLAHYNFIQNGTLKIRFMSKIAPLARKPMASLTSSDGFLVAEYSWLIPDIENKLERFDYSGRKVKSFASHKFYTGPQGKKEGQERNKKFYSPLSFFPHHWSNVYLWPNLHAGPDV